jgi:hypothetical protein
MPPIEGKVLLSNAGRSAVPESLDGYEVLVVQVGG